ncbi:MAG: CoB--CoM heterodisulfide reductase iron-sulfur subunit B family protein [Desulfobacterales bacterium]|nr:MAG: CoB--CoM heterodisulfide reductase iron-sulfur subunit B family protein [Desulfobacterales bacterium]
MKFALFLGCNIPARVSQYAEAAQAVSQKLDIELVDLPAFNCCGYPARNTDHRAFILSAAKNLALAAKAGLDMMVLCKCCYGTLKRAEHLLNADSSLQTEVNRILAKENLQYGGRVQVKHWLSVLYHDVGIESVKRKIAQTYNGLRIAVSYGCHALRPSPITRFDDPVAPKIFDELVEVTGAYSVDWARKLDCCGAPLTGINDRLAMDMAHKKITSAREAGAHFLCTACPYSQLQFDRVQHRMTLNSDNAEPLAPILHPQLLGLCLGFDAKTLGLSQNQLDLSRITSFLMSE